MVSTAFYLGKEKLRHSLGRPSRSDFVQSYFSRTFKKECGDSVISYITNLRINKAKELLATSNLKTFEISETVGIHDPAYFSVIFKKNTGMSPKAYRDQFLNV